MRARVIGAGMLALGLTAGVGAQGIFVPGLTSFGAAAWRESVASVAALPACGDSESGRIRAVRPPDAGAGIYQCISGEWEALGGSGGGSGDVTAVGDCSTGACFQAVGATAFLAGPAGGGVAAFRVIADADIPAAIARDSELPTALSDLGISDLATFNAAIGASLADGAHTVDTDDQDATAVPYTPTTGTDWTDPDPSDVADALDTLAAASGGGGTPGGSPAEVQYNDSGAFGGMAGVTWDDVALELTVRGQTDATTERVAIFSGPDRATPAVGDESSFSLFSDTSGGFGEMGRVTWKTNAASGASQSSRIDFLVNLAGTMTTALRVSAYGTAPAVGLPAGTSSTPGWNFGAEASGNGSDEGCHWVSNGIVACVGQGGEAFRWQSGILRLPVAGLLNWSTDFGITRTAAAKGKVTDGASGYGTLTQLLATLVPQASPPTCPAAEAGIYFDSSGSGAFCACPPGGSWTILIDFGSGNCT